MCCRSWYRNGHFISSDRLSVIETFVVIDWLSRLSALSSVFMLCATTVSDALPKRYCQFYRKYSCVKSCGDFCSGIASKGLRDARKIGIS